MPPEPAGAAPPEPAGGRALLVRDERYGTREAIEVCLVCLCTTRLSCRRRTGPPRAPHASVPASQAVDPPAEHLEKDDSDPTGEAGPAVDPHSRAQPLRAARPGPIQGPGPHHARLGPARPGPARLDPGLRVGSGRSAMPASTGPAEASQASPTGLGRPPRAVSLRPAPPAALFGGVPVLGWAAARPGPGVMSSHAL